MQSTLYSEAKTALGFTVNRQGDLCNRHHHESKIEGHQNAQPYEQSPYCFVAKLAHDTSHFRCGTELIGPAFLRSRFISRQVASSLNVGENVCILTHRARSATGKVDQSLLSCSRVRRSDSRQSFKLSPVSFASPASAAPRQLAVTSQLGTLSAVASLEENHMPTETAAMAIINCRDMTVSWTPAKLRQDRRG